MPYRLGCVMSAGQAISTRRAAIGVTSRFSSNVSSGSCLVSSAVGTTTVPFENQERSELGKNNCPDTCAFSITGISMPADGTPVAVTRAANSEIKAVCIDMRIGWPICHHGWGTDNAFSRTITVG